MSFIKNFLKFILLSTLIVTGVLFYLRYSTSFSEDELKRNHISLQENGEISGHESIEYVKPEKNRQIKNLNPLERDVRLLCVKDQSIVQLLREIQDSSEVRFILPEKFNPGKTEFAVDAFSMKIKDILEIFLTSEKYIWFSKDTNSVIILEK